MTEITWFFLGFLSAFVIVFTIWVFCFYRPASWSDLQKVSGVYHPEPPTVKPMDFTRKGTPDMPGVLPPPLPRLGKMPPSRGMKW